MMGVSHALMIRHSRRLPNEIMLELVFSSWKQLTRGQWHYYRFSESGPSLHQNCTCPGMKLVVKFTLQFKGQ
jgi:hypothetical protein